jgi:hypothetical protein
MSSPKTGYLNVIELMVLVLQQRYLKSVQKIAHCTFVLKNILYLVFRRGSIPLVSSSQCCLGTAGTEARWGGGTRNACVKRGMLNALEDEVGYGFRAALPQTNRAK